MVCDSDSMPHPSLAPTPRTTKCLWTNYPHKAVMMVHIFISANCVSTIRRVVGAIMSEGKKCHCVVTNFVLPLTNVTLTVH